MSWFPDPGDDGELLATLKKAHERGERGAILASLFVYFEHGRLTIPAWLAKAFVDAYYPFLDFKVKSLDEVFGGHKGAQLRTIRHRLEIRFEVFDRVNELREERRSERKSKPRSRCKSDDSDVFTIVGKEYKVGGGKKTQKIYYDAKDTLQRLGLLQDYLRRTGRLRD